MDAVNVSIASSRENLLQIQDQSSRQRRKLAIIIYLLVIFSLLICSIVSVFAVLKHNIEAQALSENPSKAIRSACSVTPYPYTCFEAIWDLHATNTININSPSEIFRLSVRAAFFELDDLISITRRQISETKNSRTRSALRGCEDLFNGSLVLLHKTMEVMDHHRGENLFKENRSSIFVFRTWISNASKNLEICCERTKNDEDLDGVRLRMTSMTKMEYMAKPYIDNSLMMLVKMDAILDMFDPCLQSILANLLLSSPEYVFTITLFCSQYLVIIVLLFMVLRLFS